MTFKGYQVLDCKVLSQQGSFRRERIWISGWWGVGESGSRYIWGLTGKETEITREVITPIFAFDVIQRGG